ncbi:MAG: hypothetical protein PUF13_11685, partial [Lachnospiraceae bacterium]|nr:hypothetical protein [Lachnospiraceae bacterium]
MMLFYQLSDIHRCVSGACFVLLTIAAVSVWIVSILFHLGFRYIAFSLIPAVVSAFFLQGINDVTTCLYREEPFTFFAGVAGNLPWAAEAFVLAAGSVAEFVLAVRMRNKIQHSLTVNAVKEGLDTLPEGICYYNEEGQILLINAQMNRISWQLFGTEVLNGERFWQSLCREEEKAPETGSVPESHILIRTPDGMSWDVSRRSMELRRHSVYELSACDMTRQCELNLELQKRNRQLSEVNERLRIYSREVEQIVTEQEILAARMQIHDNVGRSLLAFRSWLENPESSRDREELLLFWKYTIDLLKNEAPPVPESNSWEQLQRAAEALSVMIAKDGELPDNGTERQLLIAALHECLTNT